MKAVGLFEAKTHLSELIARVEKGESIIITRRGEEVAQIVPFASEKALRSKEAARRIFALQEEMRQQFGDEDKMTIREMIEEGRR